MNIDSHSHVYDQDTLDPNVSLCVCGAAKIQHVIYEPVKEQPEKKATLKSERPDPTKHPETNYLFKAQINALLFAKLSKEIWLRFFEKGSTEIGDNAIVLKNAIKDPETRVREMEDLQARIKYIMKMPDSRQKISEWEKVKAQLLLRTTYNISKVANMLQISDKHATNAIKSKQLEIENNIRWFPKISLRAPRDLKRGELYDWNIEHWYNEQIVRKNIGLTMKQPFS